MIKHHILDLNTDEGWSAFRQGKGDAMRSQEKAVDTHIFYFSKDFQSDKDKVYVQFNNGQIVPYTIQQFKDSFKLRITETLKEEFIGVQSISTYVNFTGTRWFMVQPPDNYPLALRRWVDSNGEQVGDIELIKNPNHG